MNGNHNQDIEKLKCQKCGKLFFRLTQLRYHYCSHFFGLLKKRFDHMFDDNKCLLCLKTFKTPRYLFVHIGVSHGKIDEILKMKGLTVRSDPVNTRTVAPSVITGPSSVPSSTASSIISTRRKPEISPCNYELECEVCGQKQRSIQVLEHHYYCHFIMELNEQYSNLIDGLKCTICESGFEQKHPLLLHISHGKVNDILK